MHVASPADKLEELFEACVAIARGLDLEETLQTIVAVASRVTGARYVALGVVGADRRIARFITHGVTAEQIEKIGPFPHGRGLLGVLIDEGQTLRIKDLNADPRAVGFPEHHPPMTSFLGVPVQARGQVFGNLYLTEAPGGEFSEEDERIVELLAAQAGVAVENARLYEESRRQTEEARRAADARASLATMAGTILRERDVPQVMESLAETAAALLGASLVGVGRPDEVAGVLRYDVAAGRDADALRGVAAPLASSLAGAVVSAGVPIRTPGTDPTRRPATTAFAGRPLILVPITVADEAVAVIGAARDADDAPFSADDQELLEALASLGAVGFQTARAFGRERARSEGLARLREAEAEAAGRRETLVRIAETQERERRRLAQDLHDRTAGALTSVLFALKRLEREQDEAVLRERLAETRADIAAAIEDVRDLIADLRPKVLDDFGLGPALERLSETVERRSGLTVHASLDEGLGRVGPELATAAYRIAQEALTNVVRHAAATSVRISAAVVGDDLVLMVEDDGVGLAAVEAADASGGYGVGGMEERAHMVGGTVALEAPSGGGTRVRFEAPL